MRPCCTALVFNFEFAHLLDHLHEEEQSHTPTIIPIMGRNSQALHIVDVANTFNHGLQAWLEQRATASSELVEV